MKSKYQKAITEIKASDELKNRIISEAKKKSVNTTIPRSPLRFSWAAASCAALIILVIALYQPISTIILNNGNSHLLTSDGNPTPGSSPTPSTPSGNPEGVYSREKVSYEKALYSTGWPIIIPDTAEFKGYVLVTSPRSESPELEYTYTFGSVRLSSVFSKSDYQDFQEVQYNGFLFLVDIRANNHSIVLPGNITFYADIDASLTQTEAMDVIISILF